ncbi:MAG: hypothetical protein Q9178_000717 [Gyalolechia marmorata]
MSAPPPKRQRANTAGDTTNTSTTIPTTPTPDYQSIINTFDATTTKTLLLAAAQHHPSIAHAVITQHEQNLAAERTRVIDFDHHSKSIWRALTNADKMSGSHAWEASFDVTDSIQSAVETIVDSTPAHASLGTKKSALYTLRKICKIIVVNGSDTCGREVCKTVGEEETLEKGMLDVVGRMSEEEKECFRGDTEWVGKMEELLELGERWEMFERIGDVLVEMGLVEDTEEEYDDDDEEEEEEEEDQDGDGGGGGSGGHGNNDRKGQDDNDSESLRCLPPYLHPPFSVIVRQYVPKVCHPAIYHLFLQAVIFSTIGQAPFSLSS